MPKPSINYSLKLFLKSIFLICLSFYASVLMAQTKEDQNQVDTTEDLIQKKIEQVIQKKLSFYADLFQDVDFVLLDSSGNVSRNMAALQKILGKDPTPLDYEHPESLRHELLLATLMRIELLLYTDVGSATMFKPGKESLANRKYVCVVTMDPMSMAKDDRSATRNLLSIDQKDFEQIPKANYLNSYAYLRFSLDHEIYHCLDTMTNGGMPMSKLKYWGDYHMLREESAADTYGLLMHLSRQDSLDSFGRLIRQIRGLSLLSDDINHYTYVALGLALKQEVKNLKNKDCNSLRIIANQIGKKVFASYESYLRYAQAACKAVNHLGGQCAVDDYRSQDVDEELVHSLIRATRESYRELVGHELPVRQ